MLKMQFIPFQVCLGLSSPFQDKNYLKEVDDILALYLLTMESQDIVCLMPHITCEFMGHSETKHRISSKPEHSHVAVYHLPTIIPFLSPLRDSIIVTKDLRNEKTKK
jgi:hypothetical protein